MAMESRSRTGPSRTGPSRTGPSRTGPSRTGPSRTGPSRDGPAPSPRDADEKSGGVASAQPRPSRFVTTVTDSGSEVPVRLNHKVFIDGLPYANQRGDGQPSVEDELIQFAAAWRVGRAVRLIKKDGQGFGFLVLHSPHSVDVAVRVLNGRKFLGRTLRVEVPKPKDMEGPAGAGGKNNNNNNNNNGDVDDGKGNFARQVLLSDLAQIAQAEIIREILRDVAPQMEKRLESVKMTSRNRKAFLTFAAPSDVEPAVNFLNGYMMLGRRIAAVPAAPPGACAYSAAPIRRGAQPLPPLPLRAGHSASAPADDKDHKDRDENVEEDEAPVIPLGMQVAAVQKAKKAQPGDTDRRSNVTGVTEKYNLLDKGPAEVFVGNIGEEVTEEQLRAHFASCGKIVKCEVIVNKSTRLPVGIARIVFALPAYAAYAQKNFHGSRLSGHVLRVDRGDEASAPIASELPPRDDDEEVDEDAYMEHYGVKDKKSYFKGTSFDEKKQKGKLSKDKTVNGKRARETLGVTEDEEGEEEEEKLSRGKGSKKKSKIDNASFKVSAAIPLNENSDSDEEEHFHDVDHVDVPTTLHSKTAKGKKNMKSQGKKKVKGNKK